MRQTTKTCEDASFAVQSIFVVKESSSKVMVPPTRQGSCFDSAKEGSTLGETAEPFRLRSAGASEKQVESSKAGLRHAEATAKGWGVAG